MSIYKELNEKLQPYVEDYDSWLADQVDAYMDPKVSEVEVSGVSYFKIKAKRTNGQVLEFDKIPLQVYCTLDVTDEDDRTGKCYPISWDKAQERAEELFNVQDLSNYDTYVETLPEEQLLPEYYELVGVIDFADGHSFEDLELQESF